MGRREGTGPSKFVEGSSAHLGPACYASAWFGLFPLHYNVHSFRFCPTISYLQFSGTFLREPAAFRRTRAGPSLYFWGTGKAPAKDLNDAVTLAKPLTQSKYRASPHTCLQAITIRDVCDLLVPNFIFVVDVILCGEQFSSDISGSVLEHYLR